MVKCKKCNHGILRIEYSAVASDKFNWFRISCSVCKKYSAWRKSKLNAEKAFYANKFSDKKDWIG